MKHSLFRFVFMLFLLYDGSFFAQTRKADSLGKLVVSAATDTAKARLMYQQGWELRFADPEKSKALAERSLAIAQKEGYPLTEANDLGLLGVLSYLKQDYKTARELYKKALPIFSSLKYDRGIASCYSNLANIFTNEAAFDSAIFYQRESLALRIKVGDPKPIGDSYNNLGNIYNLKGDYALAQEYLLKALKPYETAKDNAGLGFAYYNIARAFYVQGKYKEALEYNDKSRVNREKLDDRASLSNNYILEASVYVQMTDYEKALTSINKAIEIQKQINDGFGIMYSYQTLASIYYHQKLFDRSLEYYELSKKAAEESNSPQLIMVSLFSIGSIYQEKGDLKKAIAYQEEALRTARKYDAKEEVKDALRALAYTYRVMKDPAKALDYLDKFILLNDSLKNEENNKQLSEFQAKYENAKKEQEIALLKKNEEIGNERMAKQNIVTWAIGAGLVLLLVLALILFRRYQEKQKANVEITQQKEIIEEKQKEIVDSINYAKRIQYTLLANDELLRSNLPGHFVFFRPKDIVSGDFYWATKKEDRFYLAVCDSTGHGVPGAFMSLLNISFLNEAINEKNISEPNKVLDHVRSRLIENISQEGAQDGMDAIVLCIQRSGSDNYSITYAAANNAPLQIRKGGSQKLSYDKMPVGKGERMDPFQVFTINATKGDSIFLFTDGFADQFGGPKGKKFKYKNLEEKLNYITGLSPGRQSELLSQAFTEWQGGYEQVDDVCVIGITF
jgi:serine phosphatase RsbU (regulator of sigma subunit)